MVIIFVRFNNLETSPAGVGGDFRMDPKLPDMEMYPVASVY
jgi:hypothetical protein